MQEPEVTADEVVQELGQYNPMLLELVAQRVLIRKLQAERDVTTGGSGEEDGG